MKVWIVLVDGEFDSVALLERVAEDRADELRQYAGEGAEVEIEILETEVLK